MDVLYSSFLILNIQSINPSASSHVRWKVHDLLSHIETERVNKHELPFIALTETWLKSYISDAQLHIPGYNISRCDRDKRVGGGVLLYSHEDLPVSSCKTYDDGTSQALFAVFNSTKMCIANIYRPPNAPSESFSEIIKFLKKNISDLNDDSYQFCIVGDFNFPAINWETNSVTTGSSSVTSSCATALLSFMSDHFMNQYVMLPTRGNNTLDLFITDNDHLVTNVTSTDTSLSDHKMLDVMLSFNPTSPSRPHVNVFDDNDFRSLDFSKADFEEINDQLSLIDWNSLRGQCSQEEFPALFTDTLFQVCQSHVPKKKIKTGRPKVLHALRRKKKRLQTRLDAINSNGGNPQHARNLHNQISLICYDIKEAIYEELDHREQKAVDKIKVNPKYFYSYAKSFSKVQSKISMLFNTQGEVETDSTRMADIFQNQFSSVYSNPDSPDRKEPDFTAPTITKSFSEYSLDITNEDVISAIKDIKIDSACGPDGIPVILLKQCCEPLCEPIRIIWEESITTSIVPSYYKKAYVTPLYKKGDRAQPVSYRPVSLTSHVMKIYERILRKTMVNYIEDNNILSSKQHGFRSGKSCLTQLLSHFDDIMLGLTNNHDTDAIYLDYAKAFDKVDHKLLLSKLHRYGFSANIIDWIKSFLTDRSQNVVLNGHQSTMGKILSGVPQGTVLGPILFILFIDDLQHYVKHSQVRFFADDTRLSKQISCESDVSKLQEDLENVICWSKHNNMSLHEDKFELMIHRAKKYVSLHELPFICDELMTYSLSSGDTLYPVQHLRDLGVIVSSDLSWSLHIATTTKKARSIASWVFSVFKTRNTSVMMTLYKSLVRSILEYCCPLWNPWKIADIQELETVQRSFTRKIWGVQHLSYWERLRHLGLMSLQRRRERYIILQMWKTLQGTCPNDVNIQFNPLSRSGIKAKVPYLNKTSQKCHQSLYDHSFAVHGPRLWNTIPSNLTLISEFEGFKNSLTKFLLTMPDQPPVRGYVRANDNSVLEWCKNRTWWSDNLMAN